MSFLVRYRGLSPVKPTPNPYPSRFPRWRQHLSFLPFFFLLLLGGVFRLYPSLYTNIQQVFFEGTAWVQGIVMHPIHEGGLLLREGDSFFQLRQNAATLHAENEALKWKVQHLESLRHEYSALRRALQLPDISPYEPRPVPVLSAPYDGLHHILLVAGGTRQGFEKNQAIVAPEGVVGRISKVGHNVARVLLLSDKQSRVPVMTAHSNQKAILAGEGTAFPVLVYVGDMQKIVKGEQVVTSGLGGIFPPGLPVGVVEDVTNGKIRVRLTVQVQKLDWVHGLHLPSTKSLQEATLTEE